MEMEKVSKELFPIKAHYFFFMSAMGPVLPYFPIFGKMLGISELSMRTIIALVPIINTFMKPFFGFLLDYFHKWRKLIFITVLLFTSVIFLSMTFIPHGLNPISEMDCHNFKPCGDREMRHLDKRKSGVIREFCLWECPGRSTKLNALIMKNNKTCALSGLIPCRPEKDLCKLSCRDESFATNMNWEFWAFVIFISFGNLGYAVSNCLSDVICFDILGSGDSHKYGEQRVWGSIGFGTVAIAGAILHYFVSNQKYTSLDYMPALCLATVFMIIDFLCCFKVKLPTLPSSTGIIRDTYQVIKKPQVTLFLFCAIFIGMCDSTIIFYLFWHLEELAEATGYSESIILLEGVVIAVETLLGEVVCFLFAGYIIKSIGHTGCITLGFGVYFLRFFLLAVIPSPWWSVPIEIFLQGPSYALLYNTVVAYACVVAPPGIAATVQGLVGGMVDGLGFAIGNVIGGIILHVYGTRTLFYTASLFAFTCCLLHSALSYRLEELNVMEIRSNELAESPKKNIYSSRVINQSNSNITEIKETKETVTPSVNRENHEGEAENKDVEKEADTPSAKDENHKGEVEDTPSAKDENHEGEAENKDVEKETDTPVKGENPEGEAENKDEEKETDTPVKGENHEGEVVKGTVEKPE